MSADSNLISGDGSAADYAAVAGDTYVANQDAFTAADNGTVSVDNSGNGSTAAVSTPDWYTGILTDFNDAAKATAGAYTTVAPIIGGKPAASPTQAGQTPANGSSTLTVGGAKLSLWVVAGVVAAVAAIAGFFLLRGKKG